MYPRRTRVELPGRRAGTTDEERLLPSEPESVGDARRVVEDALRSASFRGDLDAALLLTSEVVMNAVRHAGTPITLMVLAHADGAMVRVEDGDPHHLPVLRPAVDAQTAGGRGMQIVDRMARAWGVDTGRHSKTVWFMIA